MNTSAPARPVITLRVAQHVLWHFGDTNLGVEPGGFWTAQFVALDRADLAHRAHLELAFPEEVAAFTAVKTEPWGIDWLRGIVKADLDDRDRGLDFDVTGAER